MQSQPSRQPVQSSSPVGTSESSRQGGGSPPAARAAKGGSTRRVSWRRADLPERHSAAAAAVAGVRRAASDQGSGSAASAIAGTTKQLRCAPDSLVLVMCRWQCSYAQCLIGDQLCSLLLASVLMDLLQRRHVEVQSKWHPADWLREYQGSGRSSCPLIAGTDVPQVRVLRRAVPSYLSGLQLPTGNRPGPRDRIRRTVLQRRRDRMRCTAAS